MEKIRQLRLKWWIFKNGGRPPKALTDQFQDQYLTGYEEGRYDAISGKNIEVRKAYKRGYRDGLRAYEKGLLGS